MMFAKVCPIRYSHLELTHREFAKTTYGSVDMKQTILKKVKDYRKAVAENSDGFSLLELVVAVGILLVLTVGGLLAYNGITDNARQAAVDSAASEIYVSASAYEADNLASTTAEDAGDEWTATAKSDSGMEARSGVNPDGEVGVVVERKSGSTTTHTSARGSAESTWA